MIDFWKMMALLVTKKKFRDSLFAIPCQKYKLNNEHRALIPPFKCAMGASRNDYDLIRCIAQPYLRRTPLSLMALGEMASALTSQAFRTRANELAAVLKAMHLPKPAGEGFEIALGAMLLDQRLAGKLIGDKAWGKLGFGFVKAKDRRTLKKILDPNVNPATVQAIHLFCVTIWGHECNDNMVEWPEHTHPVAGDY